MIKIQGEIIDGKLDINREDFVKQLSKLGNCKVKIEVKKYRKSISEQQRKYYFGCVIHLISEYTGMSRETTHYVLKEKFIKNTKEENIDYDLISALLDIPLEATKYISTEEKTITKMNTKEFTEYIENIRIWANRFLSLNIPTPEDAELNYKYAEIY